LELLSIIKIVSKLEFIKYKKEGILKNVHIVKNENYHSSSLLCANPKISKTSHSNLKLQPNTDKRKL
jgi:hypothetical protein